jgi:hypothetical protein
MNAVVLKSIVRVCAYELVPEGAVLDEGLVEQMTAVLSQKISVMPFLMKTALSSLSCLFDGMGIFYGGIRFCRQSFEGQKRIVKLGSRGFLPPVRELLRFYQKMTYFIYYSLHSRKSDA